MAAFRRSRIIAIGLQHTTTGDITWTHAVGHGPMGPVFLKDLTPNQDGHDYFIFTDHLGTPFAWQDVDTGDVFFSPYNPWGELLATPTRGPPHDEGVIPNHGFDLPPDPVFGNAPLGLSGHLYDHSTGLIQMHHRYLNPRLGHFLTPDFRAPDIYDPSTFTEPYAYAAGNPVRYLDPDGLDEKDFAKGVAKDAAKNLPVVGKVNEKLIVFVETEGGVGEKAKAIAIHQVNQIKGIKDTFGEIKETVEKHGLGTAVCRYLNPAWNIFEGWDRTKAAVEDLKTVCFRQGCVKRGWGLR